MEQCSAGGAVFHLLANRHYLGEIVHKEISHPGAHDPIVSAELFEAVQVQLRTRRVRTRRGLVKPAAALLTGRVFDGEGRRFTPTFSTGRSGRIHRYYVLSELQLGRGHTLRADAIRRVGAAALERLVTAELRRLSDRPDATSEQLVAMLVRLELRVGETQLVLDQALLFGEDHPELALQDLRARLTPDERLVQEPGPISALRIAIPRRMQLRGGRTWAVLAPQGQPAPPGRPDPALVEALRRAHLIAARSTDVAPISTYERKLAALAYLAPDLQRDILQGRQPQGLTLANLLRTELPIGWEAQRRAMGVAAAA